MVGYFAVSKAGHDKDQIYVILECDEKYAFLCDGENKKIAAPKKKSWKHIQKINIRVEETLYSKLVNREQIYDTEIKYALRKYKENTNTF